MLAIVLCLLMQDRELLTVDNITEDQIETLVTFVEGFHKRHKGSMTKRKTERLKKELSEDVQNLWKMAIPDDEFEPILEIIHNRMRERLIKDQSKFTVTPYARADKLAKTMFHAVTIAAKDDDSKSININFLVSTGDPSSSVGGMYFSTRTKTLGEFRNARLIEVYADGTNIFTDTKGKPDARVTETVGVWTETLESKIDEESLRLIFNTDRADVTFRFGVHEMSLDEPTYQRVRRWLVEHHPAFKSEQK